VSTSLRATIVIAASLLGACAKDRSAATRAAASSSAKRPEPARLARVEPGMTEDQVAALLGAPDEVRTEDGHRPWIVGARAAWAYGVTAKDGFAFGGLVLFDADRKVLTTRSPIDALSVRARRLRWRDDAERTDRGLSCHLEVLAADAAGVDARVTLKNDGAAVFERRHGHTGIAFDLIVDLYDANKTLLARYDTLSLFSPHAPDDTALMTIPPGGSISERVRLGATWAELGQLPPGSYLVRVAFPFEVGHFFVSEPVTFRVPN
jgi:hypothetical protein